MDILAARKKAMELAQARGGQAPDKGAESPSMPPREEKPLSVPAAPAVPRTAPIVPAEPAPSEPAVLPVPDETPERTGSALPEFANEQADEPAQEIELLAFRLGGEEYALPVAEVREVLKVVHLTSVPNTPDYIPGIMSHRGTMMPIFDLCKRFGLPPSANDDKSRIVIVSVGDEEAGLLVDRVTGVFRIAPGEIKPPPENIEQGDEFLRGIARKNDRLYILLDLKKVAGF